MYLVWLGTALVVMKWLEVGPAADLSWWWVISPLAIALAWFEGVEKLFGRDRRQVEMADFEKGRLKPAPTYAWRKLARTDIVGHQRFPNPGTAASSSFV